MLDLNSLIFTNLKDLLVLDELNQGLDELFWAKFILVLLNGVLDVSLDDPLNLK